MWTIEDHLCRGCGGRILRRTGNGVMFVYKCADCGKTAASSGPDALCWCGMTFKHQTTRAYVCVAYAQLEQQPELLDAFLACGCDPKNGGEVGIMLRKREGR